MIPCAATSGTPFATYERIYLQEEQEPVLVAPLGEDHDRDVTPLVNLARWHILLKDFMTDLGKRKQLLDWSQPAKAGDNTGLDFLPNLVEEYMTAHRNIANNMDKKCLEPFESVPM